MAAEVRNSKPYKLYGLELSLEYLFEINFIENLTWDFIITECRSLG